MSRSKALLGIFLIFAFGVAVGFALSVRISINRIRSIASSTPEQLAAITVYRLNQKVRFTPDQHTEALRILTEAELKISEFQSRIYPMADNLTARAYQDIARLLTPEQLKELPAFTPILTPVTKPIFTPRQPSEE